MIGLSPTTSHDREIFMDVLRGFAILGIFIANLNSFNFYNESAHLVGPFLVPDFDHSMSFFQHMFIEGKFYTIFSLLFGWGIALQFKSGESKGINVLPTVKRRLFFMLLLGFFHLLIWTGDIVFFYAMLGFLLLFFRRFSDKTLLLFGTGMILFPILLYAAKMQWGWFNAPAGLLYGLGEKIDGALIGIKSEAEYKTFVQTAGWWEILKGNISGMFYRYGYLLFVSRIFKVLGVFLIGFVIGRSDFYKNIVQNKKIIYWIIGLGMVVGLPANYYLAMYMSEFMNDYFELKINGFYQTVAYALGVVPLAFAYVGLFMLSFQIGIGKKILTILAPVGKMAFSNYVMHSFIGNFIFLHAGLGFMGTIGPFYCTLLALTVFLFQILLSTVWLTYFNYGPIEWLWRSATYKKWQTLRKWS